LNKKIIQILLVLLLLILSIFFYNKLFKSKEIKINSTEISETNLENKSNLIQNLKYEVNFKDNKKYKITAKESEITENDGIEIVYMENVIAIFVDEKNTVLEIKSDNAVFNSSNYNTSFTNNIEISYLKNKLNSNKLILDFEKSIVTISDNIVYDGLKGIGKADNIKIDLISNSVEIFMNEKGEKIELIEKN
tara:strand:+ start:328 stop:903 length:576 start_codon:yes stop_codon:yes gene_type:complete